MSPGLHQPRAGEHKVVWWDPSVLRPLNPGHTRSRLTEFLKEDEDKVRSEEGVRVHHEWQQQRATVREVAGKPRWAVVTATSQASEIVRDAASMTAVGVPALPQVQVEAIEIDFARPHGKRFGTLVHSVLSVVSLSADTGGVSEVASVQGRIFGATDEEVTASTETVTRVLRHPLMQRAAAAVARGFVRREVPIAMALADGVLVEGVIDLAFQEEDAWTVIDYKTDFEIKGRLEEYKNQLGLYALAVARSTGQGVKAVLLRL